MESIVSNTEVKRQCDLLSQLGAERLYSRKDTEVRDPQLKGWYPKSFFLVQGETSYDVQVASLDGSSDNRETLKTNSDGMPKDVKLVASVWMGSKADDTTGSRVRYSMDENGGWYKQTSTKYSFDAATNTNRWQLSAATKIDSFEATKDVFAALASVSKPQPSGR